MNIIRHMLNIKKTNNLRGETMTKLPKIRLRLSNSRKKQNTH